MFTSGVVFAFPKDIINNKIYNQSQDLIAVQIQSRFNTKRYVFLIVLPKRQPEAILSDSDMVSLTTSRQNTS